MCEVDRRGVLPSAGEDTGVTCGRPPGRPRYREVGRERSHVLVGPWWEKAIWRSARARSRVRWDRPRERASLRTWWVGGGPWARVVLRKRWASSRRDSWRGWVGEWMVVDCWRRG